MSLLGYDTSGTETITGLINVNANNIYTDELFIDYSTNPINVGDALAGITVDVSGLETDVLTLQGQMTTANSNISTLQGQMTTANSNISTLQGQYSTLNGEVNTLQSEMNTAQSDINTLQSEMNTAQSDINTLQSEMNTAQSDISALYGITSTTAAAVAGLSISQAAQDVTLAAHTASIAGLNGDVNNLDNRIDDLEVKTDDQSWGTLTGTTFSRQVHISNTAGVGDAVYLNSSGASTFLYGLSATGNISTAGTLTSTAGTSQMDSLLVNNNLEITNLSYFGDTLFCDRNVLTSKKKLVLYDANTGNDYDYLGFWTDSGTVGKKFLNSEIDGIAGSAFQWYVGNGAGSARTLIKSLSSTDETNYTAKSTFLKASGFSQQIELNRNTGTNRVGIDMLGDSAGAASFDGQIIQTGIGGGATDNRGTMTIQSGNLNLNALTPTTGKITLTSTGETEINCATLDINATGAITMDGATTTNITSVDDLTLQTTNPFGDILVSSAGASTFTSAGQTQINSGILDINATGAMTLDTSASITITSTNAIAGSGNIRLNAGTGSNVNINGCSQFTIVTETTTQPAIQHTSINTASDDMRLINNNRGTGYLMRLAQTGTATGGLTLNGIDNGENTIKANGAVGDLNLEADRDIAINCSTITTNSVYNNIIATDDITLTSLNTYFETTALTEINTQTLDINATSTLTADATAMTINATSGNMTWTTSTTGDFNITSGRNINFVTNSTGASMNCTSNKDQDVFKVNNTTFDSKYLIGSATTGFRTQVNNNSYANLLGLGNTQVNITTNNASITFTAGGGNAVNINVDSTFNMMPTASIITRVVSSVPSGFLGCVGTLVSRTTYARLFGVIGTTYGAGDGSTTFGLPDFEGCFLRGAGSQIIGGITYAAGAVGTAQQDSMLAPNNRGFWNIDAGGGGSSRQVRSRANIGTDPNDTSTSQTTNFTRENTTEVRPVNHAVYYFIRY
jgi:peptidoglycan hydrolase CwlO-like protein